MTDVVRFMSDQVISYHIRRISIQVRSREAGQVISSSGQVMSGQVRIESGQVWSNQVISGKRRIKVKSKSE